MPDIIILAIESSCDDTSAAVCVNGKGSGQPYGKPKIHEQYGGVVPKWQAESTLKILYPL